MSKRSCNRKIDKYFLDRLEVYCLSKGLWLTFDVFQNQAIMIPSSSLDSSNLAICFRIRLQYQVFFFDQEKDSL